MSLVKYREPVGGKEGTVHGGRSRHPSLLYCPATKTFNVAHSERCVSTVIEATFDLVAVFGDEMVWSGGYSGAEGVAVGGCRTRGGPSIC